jgi:hypothetical protein
MDASASQATTARGGAADLTGVAAPAETSGSRLVPLQGTFNFRDLGGYPTVDGSETRWLKLFRSDALQELTTADHDYLRSIGLSTVVDLRNPTEAERVGVWPNPAGAMSYYNLPVIPPGSDEDPTMPGRSRELRADRYLWYLQPQTGAPAIASALELIADADSVPLVFHCAAGKDRTGIVAAMTLAAIGVTREAIVADYAATTAAMEAILERLGGHPVYERGIAATRQEDHQPDGEVMEQFLDGLEEQHGGARGWMQSVGMAPDVADRLRTVLVG